ncbi:hypothetical protein KY290_021096 [Solanum tuberosum]|uniref:Protein kinase domain-containing protein n=1 Tax=Solanum tuberosum TaxID=4113 RepID=A0ABQ7V1K1_SOLTU|nr:hypothetical protein KY289_020272 [Solanum tuberosum]KAH0757603.1 hypothetical protein KY290_021096 [Solanum tuberosum]
MGGKDGNPPDLTTIFFKTRKKDNKLVEPEAIEKHAQLEKIVQEDPSLFSIEIVEKCYGPPEVKQWSPEVAPQIISYCELQRATHGFDVNNLLGSGSFGSVYKGTVADGMTVVVKVFNVQMEGNFKPLTENVKSF